MKPLFSSPPQSLCLHKWATLRKIKENIKWNPESSLRSLNSKFYQEDYVGCAICGKEKNQ